MDTLQPAFLLHSRAFSETSLLVEFFTRESGRVSGIAKGAKRPSSKMRGNLQPFAPLFVAWVGRGELVTITSVESQGKSVQLQGNALFCGFYLNELLMKLFHRADPHPDLFDIYQHALEQLAYNSNIEITLRIFEKHLLRELGYALVLEREADTHRAIEPDRFYYFYPDRGLILTEETASRHHSFSGKNLLALHQDDFSHEDVLRDAKHLLRSALATLLDGKQLKSRELFL